ncbi:MAG: hypothetical protein LBR31_07875 [Desulfovibrio sp.]|nr:hypothetical protein [Desulfovibrio sp.]
MLIVRAILMLSIILILSNNSFADEYSILGFTLNDTLDDIIKKGTNDYTVHMPNGLDKSLQYIKQKTPNNFNSGSSYGTFYFPKYLRDKPSEIPANEKCKEFIMNISKASYYTNQIKLGLIQLDLCDRKSNGKDKSIAFFFTRDAQLTISSNDKGEPGLITKIDYNSDKIKLVGIIVNGNIAKFAKESLPKKYGEPNQDSCGDYWYESGKLLNIPSSSTQIYLWDLASYEKWLNSFMPTFNTYFEAKEKRKKSHEDDLKNQL